MGSGCGHTQLIKKSLSFVIHCSGATHSRLVICDESGESVGTTSGLGTNHWGIGIPECARRIVDMVERCKEEANIPKETKLASLGLSLSGCEQVEYPYDIQIYNFY